MADHRSTTPLAMGGTRSPEYRLTQPHGGNSAYQPYHEGQTCPALVTDASELQREGARRSSDEWITLAQDRSRWDTLRTFFTEFVEGHVLRAGTRARLARDAVAIREAIFINT